MQRALFAVTALVACDTAVVQPDLPDAALVSQTCLDAVDHSDLEWIQANIFDRSCAAFMSCHRGTAARAAGLNLESGNSEGSLVGVPSTLFPQYDLVVRGDPDNSYLMIATGVIEGPLGESGTMPFNNDLLCEQKLGALQRWIESL